MEGFRKLLRYQDGEVGVFTLFMGIAMAVDGQQAIIIFFDDEAIGVHAKGANPIVKGLTEINEFRFIDDVGDRFQYFGRHFDADTDIDGIGRQVKTHFCHFVNEPFRAFPSGGR